MCICLEDIFSQSQKQLNFSPFCPIVPYDMYAASKEGKIIHVFRKNLLDGNISNSGYMIKTVGKTYKVHRFVYKCYNGVINYKIVINHINNNKTDNHLSNLYTEKNNKAAKNRDYSFNNHPCKNRKLIRGINLETNQFLYFNSFTSVQQHFGIIIGNVKRVCDNVQKSAFSKLDNQKYRFSYITEQQFQKDYYKWSNKHPRKISDKEETVEKGIHLPKMQQKHCFRN